MQEKNKKIIPILSYSIGLIICMLSCWYLVVEHSMVVQLHPLTNTFIFLHVALLILVFGMGGYSTYLYRHFKNPYYFINSLLCLSLGIIVTYFSFQNLTNFSLIIYPSVEAYIQEFHYLYTITKIEGILLLSMLGLTITLVLYNINYSYTHRYNY